MKTHATHNILDIFTALEPSFRHTGANAGHFSIAHALEKVEVHVDEMGWCTLTLPLLPAARHLALHGDQRLGIRLLEVQHSLAAPVKFGRDPRTGQYHLIGEMPPCHRREAHSLPARAADLRNGFEHGIAAFTRLTQRKRPFPPWHAPPPQPPGAAAESIALQPMHAQLAEWLTRWGEGWSQHDTGFLIAVDSEAYLQKIDIQTKPEGVVVFQSQLTTREHRALSDESRSALTDFLLNANAHLRLARASVYHVEAQGEAADVERRDDGKLVVMLEVVTCAEALTPAFLVQAISALIVAARVTLLEVQALCDKNVARTYVSHMPAKG